MASPVNPARGMRDFLPGVKARRERALSIIRDVYRAHGFDEIETPVMEDFERLHSGLGGDNEKLSFSVLRRGLSEEDLRAAASSNEPDSLTDLGLRFDLTVPLARFFASHRAELPPVFRSVQIAPVWRAERPQKGRYRQFVQADIDIIGDPSILAEIELITATAAALEALGLRDCVVRVNDRRILNALLESCGFAESERQAALIVIDKRDKIGTAKVIEELADLNANAAKGMEQMLTAMEAAMAKEPLGLTAEAIGTVVPAGIASQAVASLTELGAALADLPETVSIEFDPTLVRGMGYYTGTIFEIAHPSSGSSIGGGGRYDGMIGRFLGEDVPAAGFSIGFERIIDLLELADDVSQPAVVVLYEKNVAPHELASLKSELVREGFRVRLERRAKNMNAQLDRAAAQGFGQFAIATPDVTSVSALQMKPLAAG